MKASLIARSLLTLSAFPLAVACGSGAPEPVAPAEPTTTTPAPAVTAAAPAPTAEPEPTAEELKQAEEARKLATDQKKMREAAQAELLRFTPELRAEATKLAGARYPTLQAGVSAALKSPARKPSSAERDSQRHPLETLQFVGVKPTQTVLEVSPGEGWYTEILAPLLASKGQLFVTTTDPNEPPDTRPTFYAERLKLFLDKSPELFGKVERIVHDPKTPDLALEAKLDVALVFRAMHGWHNNQLTQIWLAEIHQALKPGGVLGVEQHRAPADANPDDSAKKGYLPEAFVIAQVEAAGFKLVGKSEINANPKDTKDYPEGVWTLPPTLRLEEQDKERYLQIGESDRMTLKFTKSAVKSTP
jgi:predicted methyltransferase